MDEDSTQQRSIDPARFATMREPVVEPPRRPAEVVGSVVALLLLLVGLPALLLVLGGVPSWPSETPSMDELADEIDAETLVHVLLDIVWLTWLWFVVCVAVEAVAARRGGLARPVPLGGPLQQLARVLVGAILLTGIMAGPAQAVAEAPTAPSAPVATSSFAQAELPTVEAPPAPAAEAQAGSASYVVQPPKDGYHDNLWDIAERHLGDGRRYTEIYELNKDVVQADGRKLELARLIQPGWELSMPADAVGLAPIEASPAPAPPPPPPPADSSDAAGADGSLDLVVADADGGWLAGGGLLAGGILAALLLARRRGPGRRPGDGALQVEVDLRIAASSDRTDRLDHVLRDLTRVCREAGALAPPVYAATIDDEGVDLLLSPAEPQGVAGWEVHDEGRRWRRTGRPDGEVPQEVAPYPALVGLGVDLEGRDVLIDLEAAGGLVSIEGDPSVASQVASAIAIQAATAPWADVVRVVATGLPEGLEEVSSSRLHVGDLAAHVSTLESADPGDRDVLVGRSGRRGRVTSHLLVSGDRPGPEFAARLGALVGAGRRAVSVVVTGEHRDARWRLAVDAHGALTVQQLGLTLTANRIDSAQVEAVAELFAASSGDDRPPAGGRIPIEEPVRAHDDADWATAPVRVGVLGRAVVRGRDELAAEREIMATEMVVHLALHPGGVHPTVLAGAVWPLGVPADVLDATVERVRTWLGTDVDGNHLLRADADGRLDLAPSVVCDWDCFRILVLRSRHAATVAEEIETLRRALALVRAEALAEAPQGRYAWAARDDFGRTVARLVADTALHLATLTRGTDPDIAAGATAAGLRVTPADQELWRVLLRVRHDVSGVAGVQQTLDEMAHALHGVPLEPETEALVTELMPAPPTLAQGS